MVLAGQRTLDEVYRETLDSGDLGEADAARLAEGMRSFARALLRWRNTHYRLAVRMLGDATGTGYTAGTPYLKSVRDIDVFRSVDTSEEVLEAR
jgi:tryptophan 2,3-dioxygenase